MGKVFDLIIVGAGPAGITASVYAARKKLDFLVITKDIGGQAALSGEIENYTGYQFITGPELVSKFEDHFKGFSINISENTEVLSIEKNEEIILVRTMNELFETKTLIISSGKRSRELGVRGETEFKNRGLSYCATCDGPLFAGKDVAVVGGGNSALDAGLQLINIASKVYLINNKSGITGDKVLKEKLEKASNAKIMNNTHVLEILGDKTVNGIIINDSGKEETVQVKGVFVEIGLIPNSNFTELVNRNELGEIKVNCLNETNIPGIFAAGDVTDVPDKQIIIAAGEGAKAALSAFRYILRG